jgi:predicted ATPase
MVYAIRHIYPLRDVKTDMTKPIITGPRYRFLDWEVIPHLRLVLRNDVQMDIAPRKFVVLDLLLRARGRFFTTKEIAELLYPDRFVEPNLMRGRIYELRSDFFPELIICVKRRYGIGIDYTIDGEPSPVVTPLKIPHYPDRLVGREADLGVGKDWITINRLITITGTGGIGKTRLAIELGRLAIENFPDGVYLIDLATLRNPAELPGTVATVLNLSLEGAESPVETIGQAIAHRKMLMIPDSCDHLVQAAGEFFMELQRHAPILSILATSREALGWYRERVFPIGALAVPPPETTEPVEGSGRRIAGFGAVQLFATRAEAVDRHFKLDDRNAGIVAEICRRLGGHPLCIEHAAARVPALDVDGVLTSLDGSLTELGGGTTSGAARHMSLESTIEWGYGLLDATEQQAYRRLGIFPGSFSQEAALAVMDEPGAMLLSLHKKSMLRAVSEHPGGTTRYRLHEAHRDHARHRLMRSGEYEVVAERFARHVVDFLIQADLFWERMSDGQWLDICLPEIGNVRAVRQWTQAKPERAPIAIALGGVAGRLFERRNFHAEGREFLDELVPLIDQDTPPDAAARLLRWAGMLWRPVDRLRALEFVERSVEIYRQKRDGLSRGRSLALVGGIQVILGRHEAAKASLDQAVNFLTYSGHDKALLNALNELGNLAQLTNDFAGATRYYTRVSKLAGKLGDPLRENLVLMNLAELAFREGDIDLAIKRVTRAARGLREAGEKIFLGQVLVNLASYLTIRGEDAEARPHAVEAVRLLGEIGGYFLRAALQLLALFGARDGRDDDAASIYGFIKGDILASGEPWQPLEQAIYDLLERILREKVAPSILAGWIVESQLWAEQHAAMFALKYLV